MKNTTLCYIEKDGKYLMLYRNKKKNDENAGKWIGVGGKFEPGETPEDCLNREVYEETGLRLLSYSFRGLVVFRSNIYGTENMYLFTSDDFEGELLECSEGKLEWIPKDEIKDLPLWEGDKVFLNLLTEGKSFGILELFYQRDNLIKAVLDGNTIL